jgi:hypothetical protein
MWTRSRDDVSTRPLQKIGSKKSIFTIFFSGEKLAFLDSLPKARIWILTISATLF